jgi:hypothetical protein
MPGSHKSIYRSWAQNCVATNTTNGVDFSSDSGSQTPLTRAALADSATPPNRTVGLPNRYVPILKPTNGSNGPIKSYILPGNKTGVVRELHYRPTGRFAFNSSFTSLPRQMFVGSFTGDFNQTQVDIATAFNQFHASGVKNILIDVTDNTGLFKSVMK